MFSKIVVGVDAREGGRDALALAAALAQICDSELIAVYAYPYDYFISRGADATYEAVLHDGAEDTLRAELDGMGIAAEAIAIADDSPGRALHNVAARRGAGLIVVGSAHRGPIGRVFAGDVTAGTLNSAPCPVLVAPVGYARHGGELHTIGVGFDGSPESHAALELAHELAKTAGARLRVIDVVSAPRAAYAGPESAEKRLSQVLAELGEIATADIAFGSAAGELAHEGNHLDLLVTGSRGYGPVRRLMLGSTSRRLVREAPCPVLVAP